MKQSVSAEALRMDVSNRSAEEAVSLLIEHAAKLTVSDLFFNTNEDHVAVAARHLGILRAISTLPLEMGRRCISHVKAINGMNVAERRRPMDGRWIFERPSGHRLDLRVNTIPTLYGEDLALRILDRENRLLSLEDLGFRRRDYNHFLRLLNSPSGLILVTGLAGSGKTTSMYAGLTYLNSGDRKINTIEDPVEYAIKGIRQSQINTKLDLGFAELLRSVLRQSPDVIMVGEIRDPETAEVAVRAANSGHLVLATLHAPIAAAAVQSLLRLGVHPHFLSSSLLGVVAQRLMRTLCPKCRVTFDLGDASHTFDEVRPWLEPGQGQALYGPKGCMECYMTGYTGRTGVFEVLAVSPDIRRLIDERAPTAAVRRKAVDEGLVEIRHSAMLKVAQGETSIEEVVRVVPAEYLESEEAPAGNGQVAVA
jgi:type II secretory ATPase GspE/PulE/Tfp pilus assembly ATPase PilB-like protein